MNCVNKEQNLRNCNCTYPCSRKGICCECIAYHRQQDQVPACFFSEKDEKTYNRSTAFFLKT
jgi:hypothetical protein